MKTPHVTPKTASLTLILALLTVCSISTVYAASTTVRAVSSSSQPKIGDTITVNITISNVQNLYGVDVNLGWNNQVLKLISAQSMLGVESHPEGVLHESGSDTIMVAEDSSSQQAGEYTLTATSVGSAPAFSGSATIATLTFNVTSAGSTGLTITSDLADHPASGETSNLIEHTDTADSVTTVVPEFSSITLVAVLITAATAALIASKKRLTTPKLI
jgi:hypothetical protein